MLSFVIVTPLLAAAASLRPATTLVPAMKSTVAASQPPSLVPDNSTYWVVWDGVVFQPPPQCTGLSPNDLAPDECCDQVTDSSYYPVVPLPVQFAAGGVPIPGCLAFTLASPLSSSTAVIKESFGAGVRAYLGCDDGLVTYGENCLPQFGGPIAPAGTDLSALNQAANNITDCGCGNKWQGPGCWKANDAGDARTFFVHLSQCVPV